MLQRTTNTIQNTITNIIRRVNNYSNRKRNCKHNYTVETIIYNSMDGIVRDSRVVCKRCKEILSESKRTITLPNIGERIKQGREEVDIDESIFKRFFEEKNK